MNADQQAASTNQYRAKQPAIVTAWQWDGEPPSNDLRIELEYALTLRSIRTIKSGTYLKVNSWAKDQAIDLYPGEWLVREPSGLKRYEDEDFRADYVPVGEETL